MEDNAAIRKWSEQTQLENGDTLAEGHTSKLWDYTRISVTQNDLQELREIWDQWSDATKQLFYSSYGDLPYLLDIQVDRHLFRAITQYWNPADSCFTLGRVDLVPTIQIDKAYSRAASVLTFLRKLMGITGMSEQWLIARIKQKGECKCIPWNVLKDLILVHSDMKKKIDVFALSIYGLVIFPRALGYVDEVISDFFIDLINKSHLFPQFWLRHSDR
ncbi:myosin heavy chain-like [Gossypium australe]|uniref:Myosin heavy chain-like n=1 Tax=Gossypium australe TaxID=47621 RepID=A0A5B6VXM6_9ROSI|nr:myosin heavy chain-like [Gossypium australe]